MAKTPAQRAAKHGAPVPPPPTSKSGSRAARLRAAGMERRRAALAGTPQRGNANLILIAAAAASAFLFWYFHLLTLPQLTQLTNGLAMPDAQFGGFDLGYVQDLKHVMTPDALGQLQFVHKTAGTLFPIVFALTAALLIGLNVRRGILRWLLLALPVVFAVVQLAANVSVDSMLGAPAPNAAQAWWSSFLVVASWVLLIVSLGCAVGAVVMSARRKRRVQ